LVSLSLQNNQLRELPPEIAKLMQLQRLDLSSTQITQLTAEIAQLIRLQVLRLSNTPLRRLPSELGWLTNLTGLELYNCSNLLSPPPEIVARGTDAILTFLRELQYNSVVRYETKLLVVGEGGTGKSSLLRKLRNETFDTGLTTTHGIEVDSLVLPDPNRSEVLMTLNTWDFGGQEIYHATHQFFLTHRSLYLVVWNARLGEKQGRLDYWLNTIKALAPDAPVLLVATHIDERQPDLNYQSYKEAYPQLVGYLSISSLTQEGLDELKTALATEAAKLPLIGQPWPRTWLAAEKALLARPDHHVDTPSYLACCRAHGVEADVASGTLGSYLHDLGKILYFRDDDLLSNMIVLKPNWVTKAISLVLEDKATVASGGVLRHADLPRIWNEDESGGVYPRWLYPVFLRLMERFDLSYQMEAARPGESATISLIPQLLPHEPPLNIPSWPQTPTLGQTHVEMIYQLPFVPAGIMSWFIVRTHRYTCNLHWRDGVILEYEAHQARVELNPMLRTIRLSVWGVAPYNFGSLRWSVVNCGDGPTWVRWGSTTYPTPKEIRHRKYTPGGPVDQSRRSRGLHPVIGLA
jgi:GTPase SAR1 family protein